MYEYNAELVRAVDGDTFDFNVDLGLNTKRTERIRLAIYDTPEIFGRNACEAGVDAHKFVLDRLVGAQTIILRTIKDKKGKYGRYLAEVYYSDSSGLLSNLGEELYEAGLAKIYGK